MSNTTTDRETVVRAMAQVIRQRCREGRLTVEAYGVTILRNLTDDDDAVSLTLSAISRIAAEDDRASAGPIRAQSEQGDAR